MHANAEQAQPCLLHRAQKDPLTKTTSETPRTPTMCNRLFGQHLCVNAPVIDRLCERSCQTGRRTLRCGTTAASRPSSTCRPRWPRTSITRGWWRPPPRPALPRDGRREHGPGRRDGPWVAPSQSPPVGQPKPAEAPEPVGRGDGTGRRRELQTQGGRAAEEVLPGSAQRPPASRAPPRPDHPQPLVQGERRGEGGRAPVQPCTDPTDVQPVWVSRPDVPQRRWNGLLLDVQPLSEFIERTFVVFLLK